MPTAPSQQARRTLLQNSDSSRKPSGICPFTPPARALSHVGQGAKQSPLGLLALSKGACPCSGLKSGPPMALCSGLRGRGRSGLCTGYVRFRERQP